MLLLQQLSIRPPPVMPRAQLLLPTRIQQLLLRAPRPATYVGLRWLLLNYDYYCQECCSYPPYHCYQCPCYSCSSKTPPKTNATASAPATTTAPLPAQNADHSTPMLLIVFILQLLLLSRRDYGSCNCGAAAPLPYHYCSSYY